MARRPGANASSPAWWGLVVSDAPSGHAFASATDIPAAAWLCRLRQPLPSHHDASAAAGRGSEPAGRDMAMPCNARNGGVDNAGGRYDLAETDTSGPLRSQRSRRWIRYGEGPLSGLEARAAGFAARQADVRGQEGGAVARECRLRRYRSRASGVAVGEPSAGRFRTRRVGKAVGRSWFFDRNNRQVKQARSIESDADERA